MAMGEQEEICTLCKEKVVYGRDGQVMCWFIDQPDKKRECPAGRQLVDAVPPAEIHIDVDEAVWEPLPFGEQKTISDPSPGANIASDESVQELLSKQKTVPSSPPKVNAASDETIQELLSRQKTVSNLPERTSAVSSEAAQELLSKQKTIPYSPPAKPSQEHAFYQEPTGALPPPDIPEPSPPPNPFIQPEPPQPSLSSPVMPLERRGRRLLLSLMILLLLISSGLLAFYSFQSHSQILSLDAKNSTQAAIIQNQGTVIQRGQAALTETVQTVIRQEQATQTALGRQLGNLQATSTTIAKNTQLEAFFVKQSPYPTISVTQSVPISFTFMNAGTLPWSNQGGFTLKCTSLTRTGPLPNSAMKPVCPNPGTITIDNASSVTIGKQYTFSFKFSPSALSLSGGGNVYATFWQLDYKGTLFGPEVYVQVTVN